MNGIGGRERGGWSRFWRGGGKEKEWKGKEEGMETGKKGEEEERWEQEKQGQRAMGTEAMPESPVQQKVGCLPAPPL